MVPVVPIPRMMLLMSLLKIVPRRLLSGKIAVIYHLASAVTGSVPRSCQVV